MSMEGGLRERVILRGPRIILMPVDVTGGLGFGGYMARSVEEEIKRRRTFAIISHPDAGKTTLTEKFLLYGGQINLAGSVKGKATARHAVSDWMEIEKERGISVTSSVLQFEYDFTLYVLYKREASEKRDICLTIQRPHSTSFVV